MINPAKISIIVPVYNTKKYLTRCLDSLVNQTFQDIEILCVNDGSTDGSLEILKSYEEKDRRVKVFNQKNSGPATSRNTGLKNATGEYLMFCDSDDWYELNMCERMLDTIREHNVDLVMCNRIPHFGQGCHRSVTANNITAFSVLKIDDELRKKTNVLLWNKIFKKSFVDDFKISFPDGYEHDDAAFLYQYISVAKNFYYLDELLYNYYIRKNSIMDNFHKDKNHRKKDLVLSMECFFNFLLRNNLFEKMEKFYIDRLKVRVLWSAKYLNNRDKKTVKKLLRNHINNINNVSKNKYTLKDFMVEEINSVGKIALILRIRGLWPKFHTKYDGILLELQKQKNTSILHEIKAQEESTLYFSKHWEFSRIKSLQKEIERVDLYTSYRNLTNNLDIESVNTVNKILARIQFITDSNNEDETAFDIFDEEEAKQIKKARKDLKDNILKIGECCYVYKKYFLPRNIFEANVFYYRYGLSSVNSIEKLKNKDIIDAGAFIGDSALILSEYTNRNVYAFEPVKEHYEGMLETIKLNNSKNIRPQNMALGSKDEELKICLRGVASGLAVMLDGYKKETVRVTTLDKFVEKNNLDVGLIKVDVEGFEPEFLKGAEKTIRRFRPVLLLSIYHNMDDFFNIKPLVESWNLGYSFSVFKPADGSVRGETLLIAQILE